VSATVDVHILVYSTARDEPLGQIARELVERLQRGPELLYLFWPVLLGYLRIVTHPGIAANPLSTADACKNITQLIAGATVRTPGELDGFWDLYQQTADRTAHGNVVPDAHVATLMRQHGVRVIYTRDRGFRRFEGIEPIDPFA
jgi:uncharacterized protein